MTEEELKAIDLLENGIADYIIEDYCIKNENKLCGTYCEKMKEDCIYNQAIDKVIEYIEELEKTNRILLNENAKKNETINNLKCENHDMKEQLQFFIPRRRVRRVYKQLGKILVQDGMIDDLEDGD